LLLLHAIIRRTILVESYEVKSAVKITHYYRRKRSSEVPQKENAENPTSQPKNQGKTSQDHGMIQEKRKKTGQHKVTFYEPFIQMINFSISNSSYCCIYRKANIAKFIVWSFFLCSMLRVTKLPF